eukprot:TRINITY_DN5797_c0_g1_i14.p1 TRINITY_DN5797_c0_g1~~TRINITY_DN5797_c0_g1_i14.p1  ORF type:complete len:152 (-),score=9.09 TRINITY_DN5797_c0_g1_i14:743-1198(-)
MLLFFPSVQADLSLGVERFKVECRNDVDSELFPFIHQYKIKNMMEFSSTQLNYPSCDCAPGECLFGLTCECLQRMKYKIAYDVEGRLLHIIRGGGNNHVIGNKDHVEQPIIFECNPSCLCCRAVTKRFKEGMGRTYKHVHQKRMFCFGIYR